MDVKRTAVSLGLAAILALATGGLVFGQAAPAGQSAGENPASTAPAATTQPSEPGKPIEFHFVAKPGDVQRSRIVTKAFGSMSMGPLPPQKFSQRFEQELITKCLAVNPDGSVSVEMTLPNVATQVNIGGLKLEIDTRKPSATSQPVVEAMEKVFGAITKVKCQVTFSAQGEPLKVHGLSQGVRDALTEVNDLLAVPGMKQLMSQMQEYLGDNIIEEQLRSIFRLLPDGGKARVGDRWTREWQVHLPMCNIAAQGKGEYQLLGIEQFHGRPCAKIRMKSTLNTVSKPKGEGAEPAAPRGLMDRVKFSMAASGGNGIAYVDYTRGTLVQLRETQRIAIEMSLEPDPSAESEALRAGLRRTAQNMTTSLQMELLDENGSAVGPSGDTAPAAGNGASASPATH